MYVAGIRTIRSSNNATASSEPLWLRYVLACSDCRKAALNRGRSLGRRKQISHMKQISRMKQKSGRRLFPAPDAQASSVHCYIDMLAPEGLHGWALDRQNP